MSQDLLASPSHHAVRRTIVDRLFPLEPTPEIRIGSAPLPAPLRPGARRRVVDVSEFFGETSGGIRTYLLEKAAYVERRPDLAQVIVVPGPEDAVTEAMGVRCYRLHGPRVPTQHPYRFMLATRSPRRIVEHERPDVIEVGSPGTVPWLVRYATRRLRTPLVYFYHSDFPRMLGGEPGRRSALRAAVGDTLWRYARTLDRLFAVTVATSDHSVRTLAAQGIDNVVRVPLGVDVEFFTPARRQYRRETRARHGLPDGPLVGFIGRFAREKELDMVLRAWAMVERRNADATLVLTGDGPVREPLKALAARLGVRRVRWLPYQTQRDALADLHAALDLYLAPSAVETFGLSGLEALSSGTPLLSADVGGVAEQVARSGAGLTFEHGLAGSLAERIVQLLSSDLAALGERGRRYAESEHRWEHVFDQLFAVYDTVCAGAR